MNAKSLSLAALVVTTVVGLPSPGLAQQPLRIGATMSLTGKQAVVWPDEVASARMRFPTPAWNQR